MWVLANQISALVQQLSDRIRYADSSDFGVVAVTVIVVVWYINRYMGD